MEDHPNRYLYSKLINMSCEAVGELSFKGRLHTVHCIVSQNKRHSFYICDDFVRRYPILLIFGGNIHVPEKTVNKNALLQPPNLVLCTGTIRLVKLALTSMTARQRTALATPWCFWIMLHCSLLSQTRDSEQSRPKSSGLQGPGCDAGARLLHTVTRCWSEEALDWCVVRSPAACHRQVKYGRLRACETADGRHFEHFALNCLFSYYC